MCVKVHAERHQLKKITWIHAQYIPQIGSIFTIFQPNSTIISEKLPQRYHANLLISVGIYFPKYTRFTILGWVRVALRVFIY